MVTRLVVVDDNKDYVRMLQRRFAHEPDMEIVAVGYDGVDAVQLVTLHKPDLLLIDLEMPVMMGDEAIRILAQDHSNLKMVVMTRHSDADHYYDTLRAAPVSYILKDDTGEGMFLDAVVSTVREALHGTYTVPSSMLPVITQKFRLLEERAQEQSVREQIYSQLTPTEVNVVKQLGNGQSNPKIAATLGISESTVKTHLNNIYKKLKVSSRDEVKALAHRAGLHN